MLEEGEEAALGAWITRIAIYHVIKVDYRLIHVNIFAGSTINSRRLGLAVLKNQVMLWLLRVQVYLLHVLGNVFLNKMD